MSRRALLVTGAASAAVFIAGGAGWAMTRRAVEAREPWRRAAEGFGDPRLDALAYAILAPSPHNRQPWQVRLDDGLHMTVLCDLDRRLPETDPLDRQITIGFGCFVELMRQAAAEKGFRIEVSLFPEGLPEPRLDGRPVAGLRLVADASVDRDPLFEEALGRRTCRLPFDTTRPVGPEAIAAVLTASQGWVSADATADADQVGRLRRLTAEGWAIEWSTPRTRRESIELMRIGKSEINTNPDGLTLEGPMLEGLNQLGVFTRARMDEPGAQAFVSSEAFYTRACETAMAFVWATTESNARPDQIRAGHAWVRMQLAANRAGLAFHPLSQVLQEYPEMATLYRETHDLLGARDGQVVQMLARLGYAPDVPPAPRWPMTSCLTQPT